MRWKIISKGALILLLLFLSPISSPAGYRIDYILNFGSLKIGMIHLEHYSNSVTARLSVTASGLVDFKQDDQCVLPVNRQVLTEEIRTTSWDKTSIERIVFYPASALYMRTEQQKTNIVSFTNQKDKFTLLSFIHSFIKKDLKEASGHLIFLNGKFSEVELRSVSTNMVEVLDKENKYEIQARYRMNSRYRVPEQIDLKKYMMYGINWNMFNCTLKKFEIK